MRFEERLVIEQTVGLKGSNTKILILKIAALSVNSRGIRSSRNCNSNFKEVQIVSVKAGTRWILQDELHYETQQLQAASLCNCYFTMKFIHI